MKKVLFYVSEKVLLGEVACKYCCQKNFDGYVSLKHHFNEECNVKIKHVKDCPCYFCDPDIELVNNDGFNVYLNKNNIERYFEMGPFQFWGVTVPHYIVKDASGTFIYEQNSPDCAA